MAAMGKVPRHEFVPPDERRNAYENRPLPIGHGQTISQPFIVALMTDIMEVKPGDKVLEIGTGSGYQAAVLAELAGTVYTIEIVEPLAREAAATAQGRSATATWSRRTGDGYQGWPEQAPFDAIMVTAAPAGSAAAAHRSAEAGREAGGAGGRPDSPGRSCWCWKSSPTDVSSGAPCSRCVSCRCATRPENSNSCVDFRCT